MVASKKPPRTKATREGSPALHRVRGKVAEVFSADLRSLAVFRVVLALLVLSDLANRATDLAAHYSDEGVLSRATLLGEVLNIWAFSVNLLNGTPLFQALLFCVCALAALSMLFGYRTRLATVIVWVLLLSIQQRNPLVLGSGEILLHLLLFWSMFLPLGAMWSVDSSREARRGTRGGATPGPRRLSPLFLSVATAGLFLQIAFVYWFTALIKTGEEWRTDFTALSFVLHYDQVVTPLGSFLSQFPTLLWMMTLGTILLEGFGPFLLFSPLFTGPVRTAAALAFMSLHYGIYMTMDIGIFPWISAFCMVCFLPAWFWDKPVAYLRESLPEKPEALRGLQNAAAILVHAYWLPLRSWLYSMFLGRRPEAYQEAGKNGREPSTAGGTAAGSGMMTLRSSVAANVLAAICLLYVFGWNLTTVSRFEMPQRLVPPGVLLGLDQYWGMFAPSPPKSDGWFVIPGNLKGGQQVDLMPITRDDFELHAVSWEKPQYISDTYKNEHWRKYMENLNQEEDAGQRLHFGRYICREWNERHGGSEQLRTFKITYMSEETLPDYSEAAPVKSVLWEHSCF
ncbi:MAG: HTTM domain-containing protein [Rubrobacteraceae bacterium]